MVQFILSLIQFTFKLLPKSASYFICFIIVRLFLVFIPRAENVALKNLAQAFPDLTTIERKEILKKHVKELAIMLSVILKGEHFTKDWHQKYVKFDSSENLKKLADSFGTTGAMILTAHLGNFELLLHSVTLQAARLNFISRALKPKGLQNWWMSQRSKSGSRGIDREGAVKGVLSTLKKKEIVALLFDQNVTRENAAFVPLFGRICATTKIIPLMLKKHNVPLFFVSVKRINDSYQAKLSEIPYGDLLAIDDTEEFSVQLLTRLNQELERRIRDYPEGWFWFHRRWKTAPKGEKEDFYKS